MMQECSSLHGGEATNSAPSAELLDRRPDEAKDVKDGAKDVGGALVEAVDLAKVGAVSAWPSATSENIEELWRRVLELEEMLYGNGNEQRIKDAANKVAVPRNKTQLY